MSKKILGAATVLVLVAAVLVGVGSASAQSVTCANIGTFLTAMNITGADAVKATAALGCAGTPAAVSFTRDLTVGSTGTEVTALQTKLGVAPATGYFGPITKAAVQAYQASKGIPATGFVGPLTRAALNYVAPVTTTTTTTTTTTSTDTSALNGGAGSATFSTTTTDVETSVSEGAVNTKVLGFKAEASDSDVAVTNVKVTLENTNVGSQVSSTRLERYNDVVSVYMGSKKVGSADVADFSKDGIVYTKNIALSNAVVKEGSANKATFYVTVDALGSIDSNNRGTNGAHWTTNVTSIRYVDASGVNSSENTTFSKTFTYTSLANSGDVKVTVSKGSSNPDTGTVNVSDTSATKDVLMLEFKVKATGSDVSFDTLKVNLATTTSNASDIVSQLVLKNGSDVLATIDGADLAATSTFNLDSTYTVAEGTTETFRVYADINDQSNFANGSDLTVSFNGKTGFSPEDSNGDSVTDNTTGSANGNPQTFLLNAPSVSAFKWTVGNAGTIVDFFFTVEAQDEAYNVLASSVADTAAGTATITDTSDTPETTTKGILSAYSGDSVTAISTTGFTVASGDTATFRVRYNLTPGSSGANNGQSKEVKVTSVAGVTVPTANQTSPTATISI